MGKAFESASPPHSKSSNWQSDLFCVECSGRVFSSADAAALELAVFELASWKSVCECLCTTPANCSHKNPTKTSHNHGCFAVEELLERSGLLCMRCSFYNWKIDVSPTSPPSLLKPIQPINSIGDAGVCFVAGRSHCRASGASGQPLARPANHLCRCGRHESHDFCSGWLSTSSRYGSWTRLQHVHHYADRHCQRPRPARPAAHSF